MTDYVIYLRPFRWFGWVWHVVDHRHGDDIGVQACANRFAWTRGRALSVARSRVAHWRRREQGWEEVPA